MKREIIQTLDGSTTIQLTEWNECYHSKHGAIQEAQHVFIKNGLSLFKNQEIAILEIGFGTGLNAFITLLESKKMNQIIDYVSASLNDGDYVYFYYFIDNSVKLKTVIKEIENLINRKYTF